MSNPGDFIVTPEQMGEYTNYFHPKYSNEEAEAIVVAFIQENELQQRDAFAITKEVQAAFRALGQNKTKEIYRRVMTTGE